MSEIKFPPRAPTRSRSFNRLSRMESKNFDRTLSPSLQTMQSPQKSDSRNNFDTSLTMKRILTLLILTLLGSCPAVFGQEIALTTLQMQPGSNFQLGTTVQQVSLT